MILHSKFACSRRLFLISIFSCLLSVSWRLGGSIVFAAPPQVERITDHLIRVGGGMVDTSARTVTCSGEIDMDRGSVEYLAVTPTGKTYESLLRLSIRPLHLQVALLLLGLEPKNVLTYQGEKTTPQGAPVELSVRWHDVSGAPHEARAEDLLTQAPGKKAMPRHVWVFTGSRILKEGFEADLAGSLVAVWHDPAAILDDPLPGGGDNDWVVNEARVPRRGTPVEFIIKAVGPASNLPRGGGEGAHPAGGGEKKAPR